MRKCTNAQHSASKTSRLVASFASGDWRVIVSSFGRSSSGRSRRICSFRWNRRAEQNVIVADDGVAQDFGEAAAEPERQVATDALPEHHVDVRPVGGPVGVEGPAVFDLDVGAQGDIGRVGPADPHARRTDRAPLLPILRGERAHAVLVLDQDDAERPVEIGLRPREERRRRAPHLLELPHQPSRRPLARVRDDGEVGALDLDPVDRRR